MKISIPFLALLFIVSCMSLKTIPLKGSYSDGNFEGYSEKSRDQVWDNIVDFFAKNGLSIRIIDKSSGLIISGATSLTWTQENNKGELTDKTAWVVIAKIINPANRQPLKYYTVTGEWNIRIKEDGGRTLINVNLVNPSYSTLAGSNASTLFAKGSFQSTGVFEKLIFDKIK